MSCSLSTTDAEFTHACRHEKQSAEMTDKPLFTVALDGYDKLHWSHNWQYYYCCAPGFCKPNQTKQMPLTISLQSLQHVVM